MDKTPWSVPVAVEDIPDTGLHMEIEAPAAVRAAVAELAAVRDLPQLSAVFDLTRQGAGAHVSGRVSALVGQTCVVSLEPIESKLDETIDVTFGPPGAAAAHRCRRAAGASGRRQRRSGRARHRIPHSRHRSLSAQGRRPIRSAQGRGSWRAPICRPRAAEKALRERRTVSGGQAVNRVQNRLVCGGPDCMVAALHRRRSIHAQ